MATAESKHQSIEATSNLVISAAPTATPNGWSHETSSAASSPINALDKKEANVVPTVNNNNSFRLFVERFRRSAWIRFMCIIIRIFLPIIGWAPPFQDPSSSSPLPKEGVKVKPRCNLCCCCCYACSSTAPKLVRRTYMWSMTLTQCVILVLALGISLPNTSAFTWFYYLLPIAIPFFGLWTAVTTSISFTLLYNLTCWGKNVTCVGCGYASNSVKYCCGLCWGQAGSIIKDSFL
jgi:hypothetical protein